MIHALDDALESFLRAALGHGPDALELSFDLPAADWSAALTRPTINLYLYDLREPLERRESAWQAVPEPGAPHRISMKRAPLRVRLSYLLSCWARDPQDQHRLLWACLRALAAHPTLPEAHCAGLPTGAPPRLEWRAEASSAEDLHALWSGLGNRIRPALQVHVSMEVPLDAEPQAPLVLTRELRMQVVAASSLEGVVQDGAGAPLGGAYLSLFQLQDPLAHARAELESGEVTGLGGAPLRQMFSDDLGRFRLDALPPGPYLLVAETGDAHHRRSTRRFLRLPLDESAVAGSNQRVILELK